ncbi:ABC-type antimicrobial peptide transport system, permease component [hydrothermal vent metagenome]|uniref:ABC-type antimicrobial peptide transport system, permease component n=1 Tax=hydrothermal vent metagenome TaxID=652676 RepID=A0A3B0TNC2_9ZZZZ
MSGKNIEATPHKIVRSRMSLHDLVTESLAGMLARPGRTLLTVLGTVLGVAALVATLGLAKTAGNQFVSNFDAFSATSVSISNRSNPGGGFSSRRVSVIPWDAEDRLTRLNGVVAAGTLTRVESANALVSSVPINDPLGQSEFVIDVLAASPGLFETVRATLATGRFYDAGHSERAAPVAILGPGAAARLNINRVDQQPAIFVGDTTLVVIGILDDVAKEPSLLDAIVIPDGTARLLFRTEAPAEVFVRTEIGAATLIGGQAALALAPNQPERLRVSVPPEPTAAKERTESDVNTLFLALGAVSLLAGAIGIANVTLVSVLERVGEIGLRRAVGATRRHIAAQFLVESAAMGFVGGIIGASAGVLVIVAVSANKQWTPVLDAAVPLLAPFAGAAVGLIAGLYPSWRASSLEPVDALRGGT